MATTRLDLQRRGSEQSDRAHRELPARHKYWRPDLATRQLAGSGPQIQTYLCDRPGGDIESCFRTPNDVLSTRCSGQGEVEFFGMAKPVRAPQIEPARVAVVARTWTTSA